MLPGPRRRNAQRRPSLGSSLLRRPSRRPAGVQTNPPSAPPYAGFRASVHKRGARSSADQSEGLLIPRSQVRILPGPLDKVGSVSSLSGREHDVVLRGDPRAVTPSGTLRVVQTALVEIAQEGRLDGKDCV